MTSPVVAIVGPTASGKSALAMELARRHNGEIICADSRTIYRHMDIGTAKPSLQDRQDIPHHLLDVCEPGELFTVADFKRLAMAAIDDIAARGKLPILVGGTGLYVDSVLFDYQFAEAAEPERRQQLQKLTVSELQQMCQEQGIALPENRQNKRYLVRALERGIERPTKGDMRPNTLVVGIATNKQVLLNRIIARAEQMLRQGIVDETRNLGQAYGWDNEAMTGNIYRIFKGVVQGTMSLHDALLAFVQSDMQLAKRQMTWFKRNPRIIWDDSPGKLLDDIDQFMRTQTQPSLIQ